MTPLLEQYLDHVHQHTAFRSGTMEVGKARSTLLRVQGFNGEVMPRHVYAERRVATGNVELDFKRKHYKNTEAGTLFLFTDVTLAVVDYTEWLLARKEAV
jgi:hypothetical protein